MECGICNAIKKWFTKKDDKGDKDDKDDRWFNALLIMNDKEKIKEVLGILEIKIKDYEDEHKEFFDSMQYAEASRFKHMKELLEEIKKTLS